MTHICASELSITGSDNGLSPDRRQAIIWTHVGILLIWPLGTNFSEILIEIDTFSFTKMNLKMSSAKWRPFCLGLNVLTVWLRCTAASSHRRVINLTTSKIHVPVAFILHQCDMIWFKAKWNLWRTGVTSNCCVYRFPMFKQQHAMSYLITDKGHTSGPFY